MAMQDDAAGSSGIRILLLEDSRIDADLISRQIARLGPETVIDRVASRAEYESALSSNRYDLVISEYSLPDFNGAEARNVATALAPDVPLIFVSGVIGERFATEAVRGLATDYVTKRDISRIPDVAKRALDEAVARREREIALNALHESESRFRVMADSAPALIWAADATGRITFANRRFETDYGVLVSDLIEHGWRALLHEDDIGEFLDGAENAINERSGFRSEVRTGSTVGPTRWLRCEAIPRFEGTGGFLGHVGCAVDISEIRLSTDMLEAEVEARTREIAEKDEALRQSQKMEAIGQLTGGIAHDFNNMLAGIRGSADLLRRRLAAGRTADTERYIDAIIASADRAAALTHRLLAFSRRQSLDVEAADINALILSLMELLHRTLGDAIFIETDCATDLWPALTDENQFESALLNLAINARDAMPDGGRLLISTANVTIEPARALSYGMTEGDYVVVRVADSGTGMPPEVIRKAFDPFFTTKPIGQGTGLGLSTIFGFAKQIGGHARIESTLGEGTTVEIYMARDQAAAVALQSHEEMTMKPGEGSGTILVVEDEVLVQMLVVDYLNDLGYETLEANDARSALAIIESDRRLDLMVTDVGLPGMNGRELAEKARETRPDLKILFATGYAEGATSRSGFLSPGMEMVSKPFDLDKFGEVIRTMLEMDFAGTAS